MLDTTTLTPESLAKLLKFIPRMVELLDDSASALDDAIYTHIFDSNDVDEEEIKESHYYVITEEIRELAREMEAELSETTSR